MHPRALRQRFSVADTVWEVETNHAAVLTSARQSFPAGAADPRGAIDFGIRIVVDPRLPGLPHQAPVFRGRDHLVLADYGGRGCFTFDLRRRTAFGAVSAELATDGDYWRECIWPVALGLMCLVLDAVPLHTACVRYQGRGVLFAGQSGAGKSTLAAAFARRGLEYLSDDWVYLSGCTGRVHALPVNLKLLPDAVDRFFPELGYPPITTAMNGESSVLLDPVSAFGARRIYSCDPDLVVLLEREAGHTHGVRRASEEDLTAFFCEPLDCVPACFEPHRQRQVDLIRSLSSRECVVLTCDGSPEEIADAILQVCNRECTVAPARPSSPPDVVPLDLLRRHAAAPHRLRCRLRGAIVDFQSDFIALPFLETAGSDGKPILIDLLTEPETSAPPAETFFFATTGLSGCTLGKGMRMVVDSGSRRGFAFVPRPMIASGEFVETLSAVLDCAGLTRRSPGSTPARKTATVGS